MSFSTFSEFLHMDGHGLYVWLCYGVGIFVLGSIFVLSVMRRKAVLRELAQRYRRAELKQSRASMNNEST